MRSNTSTRTRRFEGSPLGLVAGRFLPLHSFKTTENVAHNSFTARATMEVELTTPRDPKVVETADVERAYVFFRDYSLIFEDCVIRDVKWGTNGPYEISMVAAHMTTRPR